MNQDERLNEIIRRTARYESLMEMELPHELAELSSFLKVLKARHYNWESSSFRKIFGMRFSVKIPAIQQLNSVYYPRPVYSRLIFIFFCMVTKRKVIADLNVNCPFDEVSYKKRWVEPLVEILNRFAPFDSNDRYPEWMKKFRNESTIYGLFPLERLDDLSDCCFEYLDHYLDRLKEEKPETNLNRLKQIGAFHDQWVDDIRTQGKAQGMIAKMIGAKTARRIFYKVTT